MDFTSTLNEISSWPLKDQVALAEQLWDKLIDSGWTPELSDEGRAELDERIAELDANPDSRISWDDIARHVKRTP